MASIHCVDPVNRGRVLLVLIMALFLLPLIGAGLLIGHWRPAGSVHHGQLLNPARPLPNLRMTTLKGQPLTLTALHGHWQLAYLGGAGSCPVDCRNRLNYLSQIRIALGRDMPRVQTLLLLAQPPESGLRRWLSRTGIVTHAVVTDAATRAAFTNEFPAIPATQPAVYLIDPLGNLVMRYGPQVAPNGILLDLRRLLKYSEIG